MSHKRACIVVAAVLLLLSRSHNVGGFLAGSLSAVTATRQQRQVVVGALRARATSKESPLAFHLREIYPHLEQALGHRYSLTSYQTYYVACYRGARISPLHLGRNNLDDVDIEQQYVSSESLLDETQQPGGLDAPGLIGYLAPYALAVAASLVATWAVFQYILLEN